MLASAVGRHEGVRTMDEKKRNGGKEGMLSLCVNSSESTLFMSVSVTVSIVVSGISSDMLCTVRDINSHYQVVDGIPLPRVSLHLHLL